MRKIFFVSSSKGDKEFFAHTTDIQGNRTPFVQNFKSEETSTKHFCIRNQGRDSLIQ